MICRFKKKCDKIIKVWQRHYDEKLSVPAFWMPLDVYRTSHALQRLTQPMMKGHSLGMVSEPITKM
jgi:hypothetical protein